MSYWQYYVARSRSLRKIFVSVKGIYYQAEIMGETITWLAPHSFTQRLPKGIDFRVMITFLDFYEVFLKFALFKLYSTLGIAYPPTVNDAMRDCGGFLLSVNQAASNDETSLTIGKKSLSSKKSSKLGKEKSAELEAKLSILEKGEEEEEDAEEGDDVDISGPLSEAFAGFQDSLAQSEEDGIDAEDRKVFNETAAVSNEDNTKSDTNTNLFKGLCFFVSREVPLDILQICILSFGGLLGWESDSGVSPIQKDDPRITHQVSS